MPKIRIEGYGDAVIRRNDRDSGLRGSYVQEERKVRDDCFDMYRNDRRMVQNDRSVVRKVRKKEKDGPQLWFIASIISALGMFCLFVNTMSVSILGISVCFTPLEVLTGTKEIGIDLPPCLMYLSLMPFVFAIIFGVFVHMKDKAFDRAPLALIAAAVFVIAADLYWAIQISEFGDVYLVSFSAGLGVLIEIVCSLAIMMLVAYRIIITRIQSARPTQSGW